MVLAGKNNRNAAWSDCPQQAGEQRVFWFQSSFGPPVEQVQSGPREDLLLPPILTEGNTAGIT